MSICQYVGMQLFSLVIKMKVFQNVKTISENIISVCQHVSMSICLYVNMSICQNATFQHRYQSCSKCHEEKVVKKFERERERVRDRLSERERESRRERERVGEWETVGE